MRALLSLLILLPSLAFAQGVRYEPNRNYMRPGFSDNPGPGITRTTFNFNTYGTDAWLGLPAPTIDCRAAASGGDLTCTGASFVKSGTPTTVASPYYPLGFGASPSPAVRLNGTTDYWEQAGAPALLDTTAITIVGTFSGGVAGAAEAIIAQDRLSAGDRSFSIRRDAAGTALNLYTWNTAGTLQSTSVSLPVVQQNVFCAVIDRAGGRLHLNLNGATNGGTGLSLGLPTVGIVPPLRIGASGLAGSPTYFFGGSIPRVSVITGFAASAAQCAAAVDAMQAMSGLTVVRASTENVQPTATSGLYTIPAHRLSVTEGGAQVYGSYWQDGLNSEDASAWVSVLTPIVTTNNWTWAGGATGDTVEDNDAAGAEGKQFTTVTDDAKGARVGPWTASCYLGAGTLSSARISIGTDGTGSLGCAKTGLTADGSRLSCTTTVGGSPTYVTASIYPGAGGVAPSDVGTIKVAACNLTPTAVMMPYAAAGTSAVSVPAMVASGTVNGPSVTGCIGATVTAGSIAATSRRTAVGTGATFGAANTAWLYLVSSGAPTCTIYDGAANSRYVGAANIATLGPHDIRCCFGPAGPVLYVDGTVTTSAAGVGTGLLSAPPVSTLEIGGGNTGLWNGSISNARACFGSSDPTRCP